MLEMIVSESIVCLDGSRLDRGRRRSRLFWHLLMGENEMSAFFPLVDFPSSAPLKEDTALCLLGKLIIANTPIRSRIIPPIPNSLTRPRILDKGITVKTRPSTVQKPDFPKSSHVVSHGAP